MTGTVLGFLFYGYFDKVPDSEIEKYIGKDDVKQGLRVNGEDWKQNINNPPVYHTVFLMKKQIILMRLSIRVVNSGGLIM